MYTGCLKEQSWNKIVQKYGGEICDLQTCWAFPHSFPIEKVKATVRSLYDFVKPREEEVCRIPRTVTNTWRALKTWRPPSLLPLPFLPCPASHFEHDGNHILKDGWTLSASPISQWKSLNENWESGRPTEKQNQLAPIGLPRLRLLDNEVQVSLRTAKPFSYRKLRTEFS